MAKAKKPTKKTKAKITKEMTFQEVFEKFSGKNEAFVKLFADAGLHCIGCAGAGFETIEQGCKMHGFSDKKITDLVAKLNKTVEKT